MRVTGTAGRTTTTRTRWPSPTPPPRSTWCRRPTRSRPSTGSVRCCSPRWTQPESPGPATPCRRPQPEPPVPRSTTATAPELPPERPIEELLAELDALIGLDDVKSEVRRLTSLLRIQEIRARARPADDGDQQTPRVHRQPRYRQDHRRSPPQPDLPDAEVVSKGQLVETDRSGLVAGYVGQTAHGDAQGARVGARRDAADRRGLCTRPRWRERLRAGSDRHDRQVHGGSPRRPVDRRGRVSSRDGRADRLQPGLEEPVHPDDPSSPTTTPTS